MAYIRERLTRRDYEIMRLEERPAVEDRDIERHDLQTFTPVGTFFFAISFFAFGALCMYWCLRG